MSEIEAPLNQGSAGCGIAMLVGLVIGLGAVFYGVYWLLSDHPPAPPPPLTVAEQVYGRKPAIVDMGPGRQVSKAVWMHLLTVLKDPDSLEIIACTEPVVKDVNGKRGWAVGIKYRAKNSFGGYDVATSAALVRDETVIIWE